MRKHKLTAIVMAVVVGLAFTIPASTSFAGTGTSNGSSKTKISKLDERAVMGNTMKEEADDSNEGIILFSSGKAWSQTKTGAFLDGNGKNVMSGAIAKGIDVSRHNGKINWPKVKAAGIDYVIIRCGYGTNKKRYDDSKWEYNVTQCEKYGIPYGVYIYSYANTTKRVKSEIAHTKRLLKGHHPQYPVYYDLEDRVVRKKGKTFITNSALKFCKAIKKAGYTPGVYASRSWWNSYLSSSSMDKYEKWIAEWRNTGTIYSKPYGMWQSSSRYQVSGISGRVDLDFSYKQYGGNTPGKWVKDSGGQDIFKTFKAKSGGRYSTDNSLTAKSAFITEYNKTYYLDNAGHKTKGFKTISGSKYYFTSAGVMKKSQWFTLSSGRYRADGAGKLIVGKYKKVGNYYYGFDSKGIMLTGKAEIKGKCYVFMNNGRAYLNDSKTKSKTKYYSGPGTKYKKKGTYSKGKKVTVIRISGKWSQLTNGYWVKTSGLSKVKTYPYAAPKVEPEDPSGETTPSETGESSEETSETGETPGDPEVPSGQDDESSSDGTDSTQESSQPAGDEGINPADPIEP